MLFRSFTTIAWVDEIKDQADAVITDEQFALEAPKYSPEPKFKDALVSYTSSPTLGGGSYYSREPTVNSPSRSPVRSKVALEVSKRGEFMKFFAQRYNWRMTWVANTGRTSGITKPGLTGWKRFAKDTIYVDVNTTACAYPSTPSYVTSIHGSADHWRTQGVHSIYYPQADGFRVYVMHAAAEGITPEEAERKRWSIAWMGSNDPKTAGTSSSDWKMYCASKDDKCAATAHYYSLFIDVSAKANKFVTTPSYVSSVAGKAHHLVVTGGSSVFRASKDGFRIYLDHAPTPLVAKAANWHVNYIGYEEPIDCSFAPWGSWSACDKTCGSGKSTRERDTIVKNNHSGKCDNAVDVRKCNTAPCPVHCSVSAWNEWSACSKTCGDRSEEHTSELQSP